MPPPDPGVPPALQARIDEAIRRIEADTCFQQVDPSACDWADYEIAPRHFDMAASTGEAILVVDDFNVGFQPQLVRYRNRLLGFYAIDGDRITARTPSVRLPRVLGDVLTSFAGPEHIPASLLVGVGVAADQVYGEVPLLFLGHGGVVFGHLVELAPEQPLVLLDLNRLLAIPPSLCERVDDDTLAAATAHFTAVAASLRSVMIEHDVRFVNASFGTTTPTLAAEWPRACGSAAPSADVLRRVLRVLEPVYATLFNSEGVVAAQAAIDVGDPADFPFDQVDPRFGNRVRVGFISSLQSGLDEVGRGTVHKAEQFPGDRSADVYLNWGCETFVGCADLHYEMAAPFGLGAFASVLMSSSYITPLGLGRLINLRYAHHDGEPMTSALVQLLAQELTPPLCGRDEAEPCVYQDPIAHRQLEVYRRRYR